MKKSVLRSAIIALSVSAMVSVNAYADSVAAADNSLAATASQVGPSAAPSYEEMMSYIASINGVNTVMDMSAINSAASSPAEAMAAGQKMSSVNGMSVTYQMATGETYVLDGMTIASWITGNEGNVVTVDQNQVAAYVQGLKDMFDAKGVQTWNSADGTVKSLATGYGYYIDLAGETAALIADIQSLNSVVRPPVYASTAAQGAMPQWGSTFVEVDISSQHAYYYQDGICVWESPIVSGTATNPERATPTGLFTVNYKTTDRVLRGPIGKNGKPTYESHVDYWMPFNGGIGLHDANWRSAFGGDIYVNNGSHGCINLPHDRAQALYGLIGKGTVVVVCE